MVERVVWDHEAAGSKPVTRTRKPAEIARFQRVFYVNCLSFAKRYSLIIAAQDLHCGFGKLEFDELSIMLRCVITMRLQVLCTSRLLNHGLAVPQVDTNA